MSVEIEQVTENITHLRIDGDLTIHVIHSVKEAMPPLNTIKAMRLNLSDIGEIDFSGLQLLLSLQKCIPLTLIQPSASVLAMLKLFQVESWFAVELAPQTGDT